MEFAWCLVLWDSVQLGILKVLLYVVLNKLWMFWICRFNFLQYFSNIFNINSFINLSQIFTGCRKSIFIFYLGRSWLAVILSTNSLLIYFFLSKRLILSLAELCCSGVKCEKKISEVKSNCMIGLSNHTQWPLWRKATPGVVPRARPAGQFQCL